MTLLRLDIHAVRNILSAKLDLDARYNVFYGPNGSGKTSILESLYLLGTGQSFRARETQALVTNGKAVLTVFGVLQSLDEISVQKEASITKVRLNQTLCKRRSELARHLPCQLFYQDIFEIMDRGPQVRRGILDFGLFHGNEDYHTVWTDYRRVLKQRNALLKRGCNRRQIEPWDEQLVALSYALDAFRVDYTQVWLKAFQATLSQLSLIDCDVFYEKGWDKNNSGTGLDDLLRSQFESDLAKQYTQVGAHQADLSFQIKGKKAKQTLSRGQQKIILIALKLAQASFLKGECMYLFDDITTELDETHVLRLLDLLDSIDGQFFFTSIDPTYFKKHLDGKMAHFFELNEGCVSRETEALAV